MNRSEFAVRLQACLDARSDPFDDAELVAWLDAHPEELDAVARLWASVTVLRDEGAPVTMDRGLGGAAGPAAPTAPRGETRRWPWLVLGAVGTGVAAALALAAIWPAPTASKPATGASAQSSVPSATAPAPAGRILSAIVEPITPTLGLAQQVRATEVLVARPDVRIEVFTQWSVR
jgi:ferric-dicitrate binding protein FerR (iron transport regulator)